MLSSESAPVLVEVFRGSLVESRHRGFIAVLLPDGTTNAAIGDISTRTFLRSAAKPFQTIPLLTTGASERFGFTAAELAVMTSSHSGQRMHTDVVHSILAKTGLDESWLQCGAHFPFDDFAAAELRRRGLAPTPIHNNCSGKHAGMLALAVHLGAEPEKYTDPSHPVQVMIRKTLARFAEVDAEAIDIAIDGCSAPVFGLSLSEMARSYARLVTPHPSGVDESLRRAAGQVVQAMTAYPELIGGSEGRLDTEIMTISSGQIVSKVGAEGVQLLAIRPGPLFHEGAGIAIKIENGDVGRARDIAVVETLRQLRAITTDQAEVLLGSRRTTRNHRSLIVGEISASFAL